MMKLAKGALAKLNSERMTKMEKNEKLKKLDVYGTQGVSGGIGIYAFRDLSGKRYYFIPGEEKAFAFSSRRKTLKQKGIPMTSVYVHAMGSEEEARAAAERELLQMRRAAKRPLLG